MGERAQCTCPPHPLLRITRAHTKTNTLNTFVTSTVALIMEVYYR